MTTKGESPGNPGRLHGESGEGHGGAILLLVVALGGIGYVGNFVSAMNTSKAHENALHKSGYVLHAGAVVTPRMPPPLIDDTSYVHFNACPDNEYFIADGQQSGEEVLQLNGVTVAPGDLARSCATAATLGATTTTATGSLVTPPTTVAGG